MLVDGKPVSGCLYLAVFLDGAEVVTVEHLAEPGKLDPVQQAFIECGAFQCGYCTPGFVLMAKALLARHPDPERRADPRLPVRQSMPLCGLSRDRKCGQNGRAEQQGRANRLIGNASLREGKPMSTATLAGSQPWYRSLDANQWKTMFASNIGWMFDGYETFALILVVGVALHDLLLPAQFAQIPRLCRHRDRHHAARLGRRRRDRRRAWPTIIGRRRTMILAILAYSLTTGLSAFAWDWVSFALLRFMVGIAIGSEWSTGASMTAEVWPDHARGRGAGLMQCGLGIGFFLASFVWLFVSGHGPGAWRIMFLIGIIPALFALWLRTGVSESGKWEESNEKRKAAQAKKKSGAALSAEDHASHALHLRRPVRRSASSQDRHRRVPDVADDDGGVVGHLDLGAALHRRAWRPRRICRRKPGRATPA